MFNSHFGMLVKELLKEKIDFIPGFFLRNNAAVIYQLKSGLMVIAWKESDSTLMYCTDENIGYKFNNEKSYRIVGYQREMAPCNFDSLLKDFKCAPKGSVIHLK